LQVSNSTPFVFHVSHLRFLIWEKHIPVFGLFYLTWSSSDLSIFLKETT
jgi:hypothetical protein